MIYWRETIPWDEVYDYSEGESISVLDEKCFSDFISLFKKQTGLNMSFLQKVTRLKLSSCTLDTFDFLQTMPNLKRIYFLGDKSDFWQNLHGTPRIEALSLHNLKCGKKYLDDTSFLTTFPNVKYLYINMLGISSLPEVTKLRSLYAVFISPRNENSIKEPFDFGTFEYAPSLEIFNGWMAVDRHRVSAESFIPVLKNASLRSFDYTQMYATEDKKIMELIKQYHPSLMETSLSNDEYLYCLRKNFA